MELPCAVCLTSNGVDPKLLIKRILQSKEGETPSFIELQQGIEACEWNIQTKYYTATIHLCASITPHLSEDLCNRTNAVLISFDSTKQDCLQSIERVWNGIKECSPQIQLLVCEHCKESDPVSRLDILQWSVNNSFEFIELSEECEIEDDFDIVGIKRVIQALHAHTWSNLKLKTAEYSSKTPSNNSNELNNASGAGNYLTTKSDESSSPGEINYDEIENDSFEDMFAKFAEMKTIAESLPMEERKKYAEEIAIKFWRSIGGDEDELSGLND